ncbi:hypothetical protein [Ureibacillus sinduriensis]|uniref:Uncharacterized protein n=1 Tax=Ureibacillus sinduriensis BLB-1 = JCM 15800 TaxID=1384057 RepID=A0A0A3HTY8_9BACL|nr:hypothetical protein [Ureibacillus sinduriensis]KGR74690.1 hypothetical protein CD33_16540 [Ureibacillus sinduriensis BLB-1 = JCM 15800]
MPRNSENQHVESTPHFDGEETLNNPPGTAHEKLTFITPPNPSEEFAIERSPFKFIPKVDPTMQRFEKLMRGTKKS